MDVSRPFAAVAPGVEGDVLVALAATSAARTGRQLARGTHRSNTGVQHVLDRLVDEGLVERVEAGRAFLYSLNRDHLLAPAVEHLASTRVELVWRLRDLIDDWNVPPVHVSLFGSAARGDGDAGSDIDLLVVRPSRVADGDAGWRGQVDGLSDHVRRWTGNHVGIAEVPEEELPQLRSDRPAVVEEVGRDAIDVAGVPARQLLGRP